MKIVILGSGSFAGHLAYYHFLKKGHNVLGINRSSKKNKNLWPTAIINTFNGFWLIANIVDDVQVIIEEVNNFCPEIIIDFMGQGMVAPSWENPSLWYDTNIVKKTQLLESFAKLPKLKQYIRASTPEVYGSSLEYIQPDASFNPSTPYAVSHAAIDFHIRNLGRQYSFPFVLARYSNFYGPGQQLYRVIPKAILCCINKKSFILDGAGKSFRSFIYADDILQSLDLIIESKVVQVEFGFSTPEEISIYDLVKLIYNIADVDFNSSVVIGPERLGKDKTYRLDCTNSIKILNWKPQVSLSNGLNMTYSWIASNRESFSSLSWDYIHQN